MKRRFIQCDVFSASPTKGNALAVVVDGDGLGDDEMQRFARWTNLAETTFLLPPDAPEADYRVRIFTPAREMPFAGHPTLGSCMAWLHTGGRPRDPGLVHQQCGVGIVAIDISAETPAFAAPPTRISPMDDAERFRMQDRLALEPDRVVDAAELDNGPIWKVFELKSASDVLAVDSAKVRWPEFRAIGLIGRCGEGHDADYEVRMLAPSSGMGEDPITGSLNAAFAVWLHVKGRLASGISISQGTRIGRDGRVSIRPDPAGPIWVGGAVRMIVEGTVEL